MQPIGITEDFKLVFGERRLRVYRDILKQTHIPARVMNVSSIIAGEYAENELRKDFTASEKVAIAEALQQEIPERRGNPSIRQNFVELDGLTCDVVAKKAGFKNRETFRQAKKVVENGSPKLVEAMDNGEIAVSAAAQLAKMPVEEQNKLLELDTRQIRQAARAPCPPRNRARAAAVPHSNDQPLASQPTGPERNFKDATTDKESTVEIIDEIRNHQDLLTQILTPVCEHPDLTLKPAEKRILMHKLRELKHLYGRPKQKLLVDDSEEN